MCCLTPTKESRRHPMVTIQLAPPFISEKAEIDRLINALGDALAETA